MLGNQKKALSLNKEETT